MRVRKEYYVRTHGATINSGVERQMSGQQTLEVCLGHTDFAWFDLYGDCSLF